MNGRIYAPKLGRMLSPDPVTQAPENGQNYNRYTYAYNNPLKFTDPRGYTNTHTNCVGNSCDGVMSQIGQSSAQQNYSFNGGVGVIMPAPTPPAFPTNHFSGASSHSATNEATVGDVVGESGAPSSESSPVDSKPAFSDATLDYFRGLNDLHQQSPSFAEGFVQYFVDQQIFLDHLGDLFGLHGPEQQANAVVANGLVLAAMVAVRDDLQVEVNGQVVSARAATGSTIWGMLTEGPDNF